MKTQKHARLTLPMVREGGDLRPASWSEALDRAAEGFRARSRESRAAGFRHVQLFENHERAELSGPEVCARGDGHEQHR